MTDKAETTYLTAQQVSNRIQFSVGTLANWRTQGRGPEFVRRGRRIRYPESAITDFMEPSQDA